MTDTPPTRFDLSEVLAAEYEYIAQTANQAHEDRARISSFYLIAVGSLVAALFGTPFLQAEYSNRSVSIMFGVLFLLMTLLGVSTIMQLARLRAAWHESMMAMNHLKEFMIQQNPTLAGAFLWTKDTLPKPYKSRSVSYYQAQEVAGIGGLMFGMSVFFFQQALRPSGVDVELQHWVISVFAGLTVLFVQLQMYKRFLTKK
jgi:hypothetical protein